MAGQTVIVSVLADTKRFNSAMKGTDTALRRFETSLRRVNRIGQLAFASITYAVGRFIVASVKAAEEAEAIDRKLINQASNVKKLGDQYKIVAERLIGVAEAQQKKLGVDDDLIKSTQTILLTFEPLARLAGEMGGIFDRTTEAAFNLAELGFGTAESNAKSLGKALSNPITGLTSLTRQGVIFSDQQKAQIANFIEAGKKGKAYEVILKAIEDQSRNAGIVGATETQKLQTAWDNLQEVFGKKILPKLIPAIESITDLMYELADPTTKSGKAFDKFATAIADSIDALVSGGALEKSVTLITDFLDYLKKNNISLIDFFAIWGVAGAVLPPALGSLTDLYAIFTAKNAQLVAENGRRFQFLTTEIPRLQGVVADLTPKVDDARIALDDFIDNAGPFYDDAEATKLQDVFNGYESSLKNNQSLLVANKEELALLAPTGQKSLGKVGQAFKTLGDKVKGVAGNIKTMFSSVAGFTTAIATGIRAIGTGLLTALKFIGKFFLIGIAIEAVIGFIVGLVQGFVKKWEEGANASGEAKEKFEKVKAVVDAIGKFLSIIFDTAVAIGEWVGGAVYDAFAAIYDIVVGIAEAWTTATKEKAKYGDTSYTDKKYGTNPTDPYVYGGAPIVSAPAGLVVNVNALAPSPEIGRSVVAAIADYERTSGRRFA